MAITAAQVKELREATGVGMMECKKALTECDGNMEKAMEWLRKKGIASAEKKAGRVAAEGVVESYIHMGGRIAVLMNLEVGSGFEKSAEVEELGKDLAMQVAALNPQFLDKSEVSEEFIENEKRVRLAQAKEDPKNASKPDAIIEKIVMGGLAKYYKEICLMQQPFVKDDKVSVEDHVAAVAKQLGTTIKVNCYTRFEKGEGIEKRQDDLAAEVAKLVK